MSAEEEREERSAELRDIIERMKAEPKKPPEDSLPADERHFLLMYRRLNEHNKLEVMQFIARLAQGRQ